MPTSFQDRKYHSIPVFCDIGFILEVIFFFILILVSSVVLFLLQDEIAVFFQLYCLTGGQFSKNIRWVNSRGLIKMTPVLLFCQRALHLMGAWSSNIHSFFDRPFSDFVDESGTKRRTILREYEDSIVLQFRIKSLQINFNVF